MFSKHFLSFASVFLKSTDFKICNVIISTATCWKLHLCLFLWTLKCYQNEIWSSTNVLYGKDSNIFLTQCWRWENSSRPFHEFIKTTIYQDLTIFHSLHLNIFKCLLVTFSENETLESCHNWLLSNWNRLLTLKGPGI